MVEEIVTRATVCIKLLPRFRESLCASFKEIVNNNDVISIS